MKRAGRAHLAAWAALSLASGAADGQLLGAELSTDTTSFGDRFELHIDVVVPAGTVLYVPEVVPETEVAAGVDRVRWSADTTPDGAAAVSLVYDVVAYQVGIVPVPELTFYLGPPGGLPAPGDEAEVVSLLPQDDPGRPTPGLQPLRVPSRSIWVRSVFGGEDVEGGIAPRPADDVFGASWNAPAVVSALAFASLLLFVAFVSGREWLAARSELGRGDTVAIARRDALEALDALLAEERTTAEDVERAFERSSTIVRRYVEHFDRRWGPAWTSTELMRVLSARLDGPTPTHAKDAQAHGARWEDLVLQMGLAEIVKFGRLRPEAEAAGAHVQTLRDWVESS